MQLTCEFFDDSVVNGVREPTLSSLVFKKKSEKKFFVTLRQTNMKKKQKQIYFEYHNNLLDGQTV